eukprot:3299557-Alexandrium_andersonii.AAC.1
MIWIDKQWLACLSYWLLRDVHERALALAPVPAAVFQRQRTAVELFGLTRGLLEGLAVGSVPFARG